MGFHRVCAVHDLRGTSVLYIELDCLAGPHADSVVVGAMLICVGVAVLLLITLAAIGCVFIGKNTKTKKPDYL